MKINRIIFSVLGLFVWLLSGCVTQPTAPPPQPSFHSNLSDAVQFIATNLRSQVTSQVISEAKAIPVDLFLNEHSAEEATASKNLQSNLIAALSATDKNAQFISLNTKNIQNAKLLVIASYASIKPSATLRILSIFISKTTMQIRNLYRNTRNIRTQRSHQGNTKRHGNSASALTCTQLPSG